MFLNGGSDLLTFQVTVTDPCVAATMTDPTLTAITVQNGATVTETFAEVLDSVDASNTVTGLCGDRNYGIYDGNSGSPNAITWITVTKDDPSPDTHTISASPLDVNLVGTHTYYLRTTLAEASYSSKAPHYTALSVQVTAANCDCDLLTWTNPSRTDITVNIGVTSATTQSVPTATVDESSKTASQDIITCYQSSSCSESKTNTLTYYQDGVVYSGVPDFLTVNGDKTSIDIYPTGPTHRGVWLIMVD